MGITLWIWSMSNNRIEIFYDILTNFYIFSYKKFKTKNCKNVAFWPIQPYYRIENYPSQYIKTDENIREHKTFRAIQDGVAENARNPQPVPHPILQPQRKTRRKLASKKRKRPTRFKKKTSEEEKKQPEESPSIIDGQQTARTLSLERRRGRVLVDHFRVWRCCLLGLFYFVLGSQWTGFA